MNYYGIDLGTTQCLGARLQEGFEEGEYILRCLEAPDGTIEFPSVVSFIDQNSYVAGEKALQRLDSEPDSTVELVKVRLGKIKQIEVQIPGVGVVEKTPQEITSYLISHLNKTRGGKIDSAVLTVPADFYQAPRGATQDSGALSNVEIKQLVDEPTAALIYQIYQDYQDRRETYLHDLKKPHVVLVFDFGGGTLDVSLVRIQCVNGAVETKIIRPDGDMSLGGNIIDFVFTEKLIDMLVGQYPKDTFIKQVQKVFVEYFRQYREKDLLRFPADVPFEIKQFINMLRHEAERVKKELSEKEICRFLPPRGVYKAFEISRDAFEDTVLNDSKIGIADRISQVLKRIANVGETVEQVLLVGGSSQIPYVKKLIVDALVNLDFNESAIAFSSDCMHAVALGAAIQSALIEGQSVMPFRKNRCHCVLPRDIVVKCAKQSTTIAEKGTPYPFERPASQIIQIPHALDESVSFSLYDRYENYDRTIEDKKISSFDYFLPLFYTGDQIEVNLNLGEDGMYIVHATYKPTGDSVDFEVKKEYMLTSEEMATIKNNINGMKDIS